MVLQQWYGLSDSGMKKQMARIPSFILSFLDTLPDFTTVWLFRERLIEEGKYEKVWCELQRQMLERSQG